MTGPVTVSERDLRTLRGILHDDRRDQGPDGLPWSLLSELWDLVRCDDVSFTGLESNRQAFRFDQGYPPEDAEVEDGAFWAHYWDSDPCSYPDRTGDLRSVTKISDFYSARQLHGTGMYSDYLRPTGIEHDVMLCLPPDPGLGIRPGQTVRLTFCRGPGPDFSERDRVLLALLRPHLHQAYRNAERRRHPAPQLTPRHWELMHQVAAGYTNTQIARQLGLSEGTVRKHLENIYGRLQVTSRTAAVTRAFPDRAAM
jgi:DNA-binding CsgD family transcriptional regulator